MQSGIQISPGFIYAPVNPAYPSILRDVYWTTRDQQEFWHIVILFPYCWNCEISSILIITDTIKYWIKSSSPCHLRNERREASSCLLWSALGQELHTELLRSSWCSAILYCYFVLIPLSLTYGMRNVFKVSKENSVSSLCYHYVNVTTGNYSIQAGGWFCDHFSDKYQILCDRLWCFASAVKIRCINKRKATSFIQMYLGIFKWPD